MGWFEIYFNVSLNHTDLVVWLALHYVDQVVPVLIVYVYRVSFMQAGVVSQLLLQSIAA